jgi:curved DNA-binding protein CbpA
MGDTFVDHYEVMQISPNAEPETIHRVFRMLATKLHPDNPETGSLDSFIVLNRAYEVLSDPEQRTAYDADYAAKRCEPLKIFDTRDFAMGLDGEPNRRLGILCLLYGRRRADADNPGVSLLELESLMGTPREHLLFASWYLREKQLVRLDERSSLLITAEGVDFVEKNLTSNTVIYRLLKEATKSHARSDEPILDPQSATMLRQEVDDALQVSVGKAG